jgi:hypothetical protein
MNMSTGFDLVISFHQIGKLFCHMTLLAIGNRDSIKVSREIRAHLPSPYLSLRFRDCQMDSTLAHFPAPSTSL